MNKFKEDGSDVPIAKSDEKKANLARDQKIKSFWDTLVHDWLRKRAKPPEKGDSNDYRSTDGDASRLRFAALTKLPL